MVDKLLELGSTPDWISPVLATVQDLVRGPSYTLLIPHGCGHSGFEIRKLLASRGVKSWGLMIAGNTLMVSVRKEQARWAQAVLERAGVPVDNPIAGSTRAMATSRSKPAHVTVRTSSATKQPRPGLVASIEAAVDRVAGLLG